VRGPVVANGYDSTNAGQRVRVIRDSGSGAVGPDRALAWVIVVHRVYLHLRVPAKILMPTMRNQTLVLALVGFSFIVPGCSSAKVAINDAPLPVGQSTPSKNFTTADIAKLKWIEGTWRGMDGDKPFYERYKIEETAMVVESLKADGSVDGVPERFELKEGEFGKGEGDQRSAASEITADHIQFVPAVPGKLNNFRFERQSNNTWRAVLDWPAKGDKPARQKIYIMEPWKP
jgi:hypothetical protein